MKRNTFIIILFVLTLSVVQNAAFAQIISTRTGVKFGIIACNYDPDDSGPVFRGTGMHIGLGMGTDIVKLIALDISPQYRSIKHTRTETNITRTYYYDNIYFPVFLSLKAGMIPMVAPYLGLGIGFNIIVGGHERMEYANGTVIENPLQGTSTKGAIILGGGLEIKFSRLRLVPEFTANITGTGDETNPPQTLESNYHISFGMYYVP